MASRPDLRLVAKPRDGGAQRIEVMALWRQAGWSRAQVSRDVSCIVMKDGRRLEPSKFFFDLYEERAALPPPTDRRMRWARSHGRLW